MGLALARNRRFYLAMALAFMATVLIGFGPTYFFRPVFRPSGALTPLMQVHGLLFSLWVLLLVVQTTLVAARRTDVHRRLGVVGGVLVALMVPAGVALAISSARKGLGPVTLWGGLLVFFSGPIRIGLGSTALWHAFVRLFV